MADTTARTLRLLSLLQRRRYWPGPELAESLGVSDRTLRRDIERLRELGYTVHADRGVHGGYRMGSPDGDAAVLLDHDEATALAVALHTAATGTTELAEASLGALGKVLTMLGPAQRRRAENVRTATAFGSTHRSDAPQLATLDTVASACRDRVRLAFEYTAADGASSSRYVEPLQLVALDTRWYLVAHDVDRDDWRTFRVDRMREPVPSRNSFTPRPPPADDLSAYVRRVTSAGVPMLHIVVDADVAAERIMDEYGAWVTVEPISESRCRLTMETDSFRWPTHIVATLDAPFTVVTPPAFREHLRAVSARFHDAAGR